MLESKQAILIAALLAAMGIAVRPDMFVSGMFYAVAAAYAMMGVNRPRTAVGTFNTIVLAMFCATIAAVAVVEVDMLQGWSVRLSMAAAGALSRFVVIGIGRFGHAAAERMGRIPQEFPLPWEKKAETKDEGP